MGNPKRHNLQKRMSVKIYKPGDVIPFKENLSGVYFIPAFLCRRYDIEIDTFELCKSLPLKDLSNHPVIVLKKISWYELLDEVYGYLVLMGDKKTIISSKILQKNMSEE